MDYVKQFQDACAAMKRDGTLTQERMTVAWFMFMPKRQAEKAIKAARTFSSRKADRPSHSGP
jgi:hypothetical protein